MTYRFGNTLPTSTFTAGGSRQTRVKICPQVLPKTAIDRAVVEARYLYLPKSTAYLFYHKYPAVRLNDRFARTKFFELFQQLSLQAEFLLPKRFAVKMYPKENCNLVSVK